jgi:hypothetical protein
MTKDQKRARAQAQARAARTPGLRVFKIREAKELPWSYYAARSFDEAVAMHFRSYREIETAGSLSSGRNVWCDHA